MDENISYTALQNRIKELESELATLRKNAVSDSSATSEKVSDSSLFKAIFDMHHAPMLLVEPDTGNIFDVNNAAIDYYGYSRQQFLKINTAQLNCLSPSLVAAERQKAKEKKQNFFTFPHRMANGEKRMVEIYSSPIELDGKILLFSVVHDITDQRKYEEELIANKLLLERAQKIARLGHIEYDLATRRVFISSGARLILGINKSTVRIEEITECINEQCRLNFEKKIFDLVKHNEPFDMECQIRRPSDFTQVYIHSIAEYNETEKKIFAIFQDITSWKNTENELIESESILKKQIEEYVFLTEEYYTLNENLSEKNESIRKINEELMAAKERAEDADKLKSAFMANMSHEIRTPMNAIKGFTELLGSPRITPEKTVKFVQIINQRCDDLLQIINDLLDISRIESGQMSLNYEPGSLNDVFTQLFDFFQNRNTFMEKKPIRLQFNLSLSQDEMCVVCDFSRLRQILLNLVSNSYKFTTDGLIEFGCSKQSDDFLLFYVHDTGIGIQKDKQELIFERFRQADDAYLSKPQGGVGLGLSICQGLITLMSGRIWVESEPGHGSTFFFTLPYLKSAVRKETLPNAPRAMLSWANKKMLIVEDDACNAAFLKEALATSDLDILHVSSGYSAIEAFLSNPSFDVVLMDIRLPDINGFDVTRQIKTIRPDCTVIAQTAHASDADRLRSEEAGCSYFVTKPIKINNLISVIHEVLSAKC